MAVLFNPDIHEVKDIFQNLPPIEQLNKLHHSDGGILENYFPSSLYIEIEEFEKLPEDVKKLFRENTLKIYTITDWYKKTRLPEEAKEIISKLEQSGKLKRLMSHKSVTVK